MGKPCFDTPSACYKYLTGLTCVLRFLDLLRCPCPRGSKIENGRKATSRWFTTSALRATALDQTLVCPLHMDLFVSCDSIWKFPYHFLISLACLIYSTCIFKTLSFYIQHVLPCWPCCLPSLKPVRWHVPDFPGRDLLWGQGRNSDDTFNI